MKTRSSLSAGTHLSLVAVSRNDDHGGDMLGRMQHFVDGFIAQCRKHHLKAELILVEWNPPPGRPRLEDALAWPNDFGPAVVRIVTVPPEVHAKFRYGDALPLFQMIGKNVGIRRARGRYVLATNVDILLDDATVIYLRDRLRPGTMLRIDRYDVPGDLTKGVPFDQVLAECRSRFFQISTRFGILDLERRRFVTMGDGIEARLLAAYSTIRVFGSAESARRVLARTTQAIRRSLTPRVLLLRTAKLLGGTIHFGFQAVLNAPAFLARNIPKVMPLRTMLSRGYCYIRRNLQRVTRRIAQPLRLVGKAWRLMGPMGLFRPQLPADQRLARSQRLHTNACGDFTLLARDDWFRLRGYPEWPIFSWHLDSVFLFAANAHNIREVTLHPRYRIYHIDHSKGSGWSPEGAALLFARLDRKGIPYLTNEDVSQLQTRFASDPSSAIVNEETWGLSNIDLPEREITPANRHSSGTKDLIESQAGQEQARDMAGVHQELAANGI